MSARDPKMPARLRALRNVRAGRHPRETLIRVSNAPLRERFEDLVSQGVEPSKLAEYAGWTFAGDGRIKGDTRRLRRQLGLVAASGKPDADGLRAPYFVDRLDYDTAVVLCRALDLDPVEAGI